MHVDHNMRWQAPALCAPAHLNLPADCGIGFSRLEYGSLNAPKRVPWLSNAVHIAQRGAA